VAFGDTLAVDQISFSIKPANAWWLVDESGSGKSVSVVDPEAAAISVRLASSGSIFHPATIS
jgi:ABC-type dipeptide/oligopeptide/nickel transport system ATPase component